MRAAFAYESNVLLLRQLLVPEPLTRTAWEELLSSWQAGRKSESLLEWILKQGALSEVELLQHLAGVLGEEFLAADEFQIIAGRSPEEQLLEKNGFVFLHGPGGIRCIAGGASLPGKPEELIGVESEPPRWVLISPIRSSYAPGGSESSLVREPGKHEWMRDLLGGLVAREAAEIHFERFADRLQVRARVGGAMETVGTWSDGRAERCFLILKRRAGLETAANALPQDGRMELGELEPKQRFRVSSLTTIDGESLVLRCLPRRRKIRSLSQAGAPEGLRKALLDCLLHENGMVIICGATGSGKTTTAYAALEDLESSGLKILSIEDPVEQEIPCAVQSSVDLESGWKFSTALRAFLRQDPDLIFLGEMRDRTSAEGAFQAAVTGHAVLATLHAASIDTAIGRLEGWGVPPGMLTEALRLVVHQRLEWLPGEERWAARFAWERRHAGERPILPPG